MNAHARRGLRPGRHGATAAALVVAVLVAGCVDNTVSPPSTRPPTASPAAASSSPSANPSAGPIAHPTGPTDVVFRFEEGGGFVPMGFFATEAPILTLYGDGTVIFRDSRASPPPEADGIIRQLTFQIARLNEAQIQAFLDAAIADGGLGVARAQYFGPGADLPTAVFTINAGGQSKSVSVMALGMDRPESDPDAVVLRALARLGETVATFGAAVNGEQPWAPDRWRGVLMADALGPTRVWPWPGIAPADFVQGPDQSGPAFPTRVMSPAEVDALDLADIEGGFSGLLLAGPDGATYSFALRPLLPDEAR